MNRRKRTQFWGEDENDDSLVRSVIAGRKTATSSLPEEYQNGFGEFGDGGYEVGDIVEVYDLKGRLRCLIRITEVYSARFGAIPEKLWRGEGFNSAREYQECHVRCLPEHELHDDFEFIINHFELMEAFEIRTESNPGN